MLMTFFGESCISLQKKKNGKKDFEYEKTIAQTNTDISNIDISNDKGNAIVSIFSASNELFQ